MKTRNYLLATISITLLALQYALNNYFVAAVVLLVISGGISFAILPPSRQTLLKQSVYSLAILLSEFAVLSILQMIPNHLFATLFVISTAISGGCWSVVYQTEEKDTRFNLLITTEMIIAVMIVFLVLAMLLPVSITNYFEANITLSGSRGLIQVVLYLLIPLFGVILWNRTSFLLWILLKESHGKNVAISEKMW